MSDSKNNNQDGYVDPSQLKDEESLNAKELIETLKQSEGVRWPGAIFLMLLTLGVGFALAWLFYFDFQPPIGILEITNRPSITINEDGSGSIEIVEKQVVSSQGTFTELFLQKTPYFTDKSYLFTDLTYHKGTDRIYLVARDKNLYWIDSDRTKIEFEDVSFRLGESLPFLDGIAALDEDRLVLYMDSNQTRFLIYNLKTNRVEARFGTNEETGELGTVQLYEENSLTVDDSGNIYFINTYSLDEGFADQIQVYDSSGSPVRTIPVESGARSLAVRAGRLYLIGGHGSLFVYDLEGNLLEEVERNLFNYSYDIGFDSEENLHFIRRFDAWLVGVQPDLEFGEIYGPLVDSDVERWALGEVKSPIALLVGPREGEFFMIDGDYNYRRLFLFEPHP